jgi:hypothetical protein
MATALTFPISAKHTLTVIISGGDGGRFAIESHWASDIGSPTITLEDDSCLVTDDGEGHALSITEDEGHKIRFSGPGFDWLATLKGEDVAVAMIVHELGHVLSWAEKRLGVLSSKENDAYRRALAGDKAAIDVLEQQVDGRMVQWGVDPQPVRAATDDFIKMIEEAIEKAPERQAEHVSEE